MKSPERRTSWKFGPSGPIDWFLLVVLFFAINHNTALWMDNQEMRVAIARVDGQVSAKASILWDLRNPLPEELAAAELE